jgi:hypothetical protein
MKVKLSTILDVGCRYGVFDLFKKNISLLDLHMEELRGADLSTRGPGWTYHWWTGCSASCSAG